MAKKHVHSKDPRKPQIVAALKKRSGGNKVTLLTETLHPISGLCFEGHCSKKCPGGRGTGYQSLGFFIVTAKEAGMPDAD